MSSFVGPRISTLGGRLGLEPCKKNLGASTGGCSRVLSCCSPSAGGVGGVSISSAFAASGIFGGRGADGDSATVAGLFSHFISEDCGISRWHRGRVVVGRGCVEVGELTFCGDSTSPPNFEGRGKTEVFEIQRDSRSRKAYHNNLQWVTADPSPSSTPSTRESDEHNRRAIGCAHRLTRAAEIALCASARA